MPGLGIGYSMLDTGCWIESKSGVWAIFGLKKSVISKEALVILNSNRQPTTNH